MNHQEIGGIGDQGDCGEVVDGVEWQVLPDAGVDRVRDARHQQRVAVRRRPGDKLGTRDPARARAVLDDNRHREGFRKLL